MEYRWKSREKMKIQIDLVQDAVILGSLLDCLSFEEGKVVVGSVSEKDLLKLLSYRIPFARGNDPSYRD